MTPSVPETPTRRAAPRLTGRLELSTELGAFLGDKRVRLLEAIAAHGSITRAAREVPLSYKAAWDAIDAMNNLAETPLVESTTGGRSGGGTRLTEHGRRLVAMYRAMQAEQQQALDRLAGRFAAEPVGEATSLQRLVRRLSVRSSARNQFAGTVSSVRESAVDVQVQLRVDEALDIAAVVTRESAEQLGLVPGREAVALVKASSLMLMVDEGLRVSARNRLWGTVRRIVDGSVNAEVTLDLGRGRSATAVVTHDSVLSLGLAEGARACAVFKVSSVILAVVD